MYQHVFGRAREKTIAEGDVFQVYLAAVGRSYGVHL